MITFKEWLRTQEMFNPVTTPSVTNRSAEVGAKLKTNTAFPDGEAKGIPRWRRDMRKPKGEDDGKWRG